ncbi:MAG: ferrous iron transport protein B [Verrucomicrobia bacterium]|nr:ferrous iron transport protein B [Verrucomicrobiota bacterium]
MPDSPQLHVALTGNPNCGKTTLFNALTGLRAKVGNYAGVTVERKEGALTGAEGITILDLPGTYSLSPKSLDEEVSRDVLFHRLDDVPAPSLVVVVVDASNLERNLYYATQVIELGYPTVLALNMTDVAEQNGHTVNATALAKELGVPVLPLIASQGEGVADLTKQIVASLSRGRGDESLTNSELGTPNTELNQRLVTSSPKTKLFVSLPAAFTTEITALAPALENAFPQRRTSPKAEALLLLSDDKALASSTAHYPAELCAAVTAARQRLEAAGVDWRTATIEARYARIAEIIAASVTEEVMTHETMSDRLDRVFTHRFWGITIFVGLMWLLFQSIFTFAKVPMDFLSSTVDGFGGWVGGLMPPGDLNDLLVNGVIKGVGAVVIFLPQILLLFLFISLLEDTGYMARAAFLMDRLMSRVGLHGKSFIPMLSSYACAIPGIMAARTIETPKDRLVTILVAPLMSCSARLPVYAVLIAACVPDLKLGGFIGLQGLTMLTMYLLGTVMALVMAWVFKKTLLKGETPMLIMELPPYKRPVATTILRHMWDRSKLFLRRAGTVILGINIVLWFLATYPKEELSVSEQFRAKRQEILEPVVETWGPSGAGQRMHDLLKGAKPTNQVEEAWLSANSALDKERVGSALRHSFAGRLGHLIEPAIAPLGFDWKMGIGIVASFAAREVFVSTMSVVYNVGDTDAGDEAATTSLAKTLREEKRADGTPAYTTLVAVSLMVFYVFALQCVSTIAVVRRETNSWKWPLFQLLYMTALAWGMAFLTYQGGKLLGLG